MLLASIVWYRFCLVAVRLSVRSGCDNDFFVQKSEPAGLRRRSQFLDFVESAFREAGKAAQSSRLICLVPFFDNDDSQLPHLGAAAVYFKPQHWGKMGNGVSSPSSTCVMLSTSCGADHYAHPVLLEGEERRLPRQLIYSLKFLNIKLNYYD